MPDYKKYTDEKLVEHIRKNNKELFREIMRRYEDKLMRYATYLLRDYHMSKDTVQESFIKAYMNLFGFDISKKFSSWIYRIVHNEAMNVLQKNKNEIPLPDHDFKDDTDIEMEIEQKEMKQKITHCLEKLPVIYSEPLALYFLEEKSYEEIGDILRLPQGTVATRINRAKSYMKHLCQKTQRQ
ncbi:MAG: sigma-70 family RNA polymerase sigma factor [Patescibacteria group bacterium]